MPLVTVPDGIAEAVRRRWPDRGPAWLLQVENELVELCNRYSVSTVKVMPAQRVSSDMLAAVFTPLRKQPAPLPNMPRISTWLHERLANDNLSDVAPGRSVAPRSERERAISVLESLASNEVGGLCHGDAS